MPLAYSYRRFSNEKQAKGASFARQDDLFIDVCKKHELTPAPLSFDDAGKSAFRGNKQKDLSQFLDLVKAGEVPKGSYLVIESLDRLSRKMFIPTLDILRALIENGCNIITANPERVLSERSLNDPFSLIEILFISARAHEESKLKSTRVADAWSRKLANATSKPVTSRGPSWLKLKDGKWELIKERVDVVRRIFKLAISKGLGQRAIAKRLNSEGLEGWGKRYGKRTKWGWAFVRLILTDRRVLGDFPNKLGITKDYYPQIIDENTFTRVQALTKKRLKFRGNISTKCANLFSGLAFDQDGNTMVHVRKNAAKPARFISSKFETTKEKGAASFPYEVFESQILKLIDGLTIDEVGQDDTSIAEELDKIEVEIAKQDNYLSELKTQLDSLDAPPKDIVERWMKVENERKSLYKSLENLKTAKFDRKPECPLNDYQAIMNHLAGLKGKELLDARLQLREAIRALISRIDVKIIRKGWDTELRAILTFNSGHHRRLDLEVRRGELGLSLADSTKWDKVQPDMTLEYGGKPLRTLSENELFEMAEG